MRAREAIPLQLSRLLEERMAIAEGVRNVHHWLSLIGANFVQSSPIRIPEHFTAATCAFINCELLKLRAVDMCVVAHSERRGG